VGGERKVPGVAARRGYKKNKSVVGPDTKKVTAKKRKNREVQVGVLTKKADKKPLKFSAPLSMTKNLGRGPDIAVQIP